MHHVGREVFALQDAVDEHANAAAAPGQHERKADGLAEGRGPTLCELVTHWNEGGHPIGPQVLIGQFLVDAGVASDPQVHLTALDRVGNARANQLDESSRRCRDDRH